MTSHPCLLRHAKVLTYYIIKRSFLFNLARCFPLQSQLIPIYNQWNSHFSNPQLFKLPDFSNQFSFPLDKLFCNFTLDFSNLPISRTNGRFTERFEKSGSYCIRVWIPHYDKLKRIRNPKRGKSVRQIVSFRIFS